MGLEFLWAYVLVFLFAAVPFFEAFGVIPLAILSGLSPLPVVILGLSGNLVTVLLVIIFIHKVKQWLKNRKANQEKEIASKRSVRAKRIWKKYGLPGLAMIGPLFVGSHLTAFMSVTLGGAKKRTAYWVLASIVTWSAALTFLAYYGIDFMGLEERNLFQTISTE